MGHFKVYNIWNLKGIMGLVQEMILSKMVMTNLSACRLDFPGRLRTVWQAVVQILPISG